MTATASDVLADAALAVAVLALLTALLGLRALARIRRGVGLLGRGGRGGESFIEASGRHAEETATLRKEVAGWRDVLAGERKALAGQLTESKSRLADAATALGTHADQALRRVAVVRYDAFPDLGGRLSFSLAVLDGAGTGIVLTSIAGRSETRVYAKPITAGTGTDGTELSPEERDAIRAALRD